MDILEDANNIKSQVKEKQEKCLTCRLIFWSGVIIFIVTVIDVIIR